MTKAEIARNPLSAFLARCTNTRLQGQRRRGLTAAQLWSKEGFETVRNDVNEEVEKDSINAQRGRVSKAQDHAISAFKALPKDQQAFWKQRAKEDAEEVAKLKEEANAPPQPLTPAETQQ